LQWQVIGELTAGFGTPVKVCDANVGKQSSRRSSRPDGNLLAGE